MAVVEGDTPVGSHRGVATALHEWLARVSAGRSPVDLTATEMGTLLDDLAGQPGLVAHADALRPAAGERTWECLYRGAHLDVWVIAWTGGADTGWHDHDSSSGALCVLEGVLTQERPRWTGPHERVTVVAGEGLTFGSDHVHRICVSDARAVTVHAYSPPLRRMGRYSLDPSGAMQRRTVTYDEESPALFDP